MKILVFTHRTNFSGRANRSLLSVLIGLKNKGHEIQVILPRKEGELNDALTKENIKWKACRYYRMGAKKFKGIGLILSYAIVYGKYVHHFLASKKILHIIKNKQYDVIYTNTILPYAGLFIAKKKKIPSVIHDREPLSGTGVPQIIEYEKFLYNHAEKIIVISKDLKQQWLERGFKEKIVLINNGIPLEKLERANQNIQDSFNLLLTARLSKVKHHMDALKALSILKKEHIENIHLFFAGSESENGEKEYRMELEQFIENNNLKDNVTFLGEVNNMAELRSKMHVELMCNPNEPFGRVTVEGMRSGLVVIGADKGGTLDIIIDNINGLLYESENEKDLAKKIRQVYEDEAFRKRIADEAFEYSNNHFTMEENVDRIEEVLIKVCKNRLY